MALDENLQSDLLANYERDWNEALEQYDASLRAARMANVTYDPAARIFEASQPPGSGERLQREIFGPLQAKYGPLLGGGSRAATAATTPPRAQTFNTRVGVFERDPFTGEYKKMVDVPARTGTSAALTPEEKEAAANRAKKLASDLRNADAEMREQRKLLEKAEEMDEKSAIMNRLLALDRKRNALFAPATPVPAPAVAPTPAPSWEVNPMSIPFGAPKDPQMFIGDPNNPVIQDEPMAPLRSDPFSAAGPSIQRGLRVLKIERTGG